MHFSMDGLAPPCSSKSPSQSFSKARTYSH